MQHYEANSKYITVRGDLQNTGYKITHDKELKIAFMGGSVTEGMGSNYPEGSLKGGFRARLLAHLEQAHDTVSFTEIRAVLGGNGSRYGVYITEQTVASEKPDLVFVEYAVNNAYDGVTDADMLWNHYETIIHTIRKANPYADIVLLYVSDRLDRSKIIIPVLEQIADKYQLPSVHLYQAIADSLESHGYEWDAYYLNAKGTIDGVHPNGNGYDVMADVLKGVVECALSFSSYTYQENPTPAPCSEIQAKAHLVLTSSFESVPSGWEKVKKFSYAGPRYNGCIQTVTGDAITVVFKGTHFGVLVEFAPYAGVLEYAIDGGAVNTQDCCLPYSNPKAIPLMQNAADSEHTITLRLQAAQDKQMAIAAFLLNGTILRVE